MQTVYHLDEIPPAILFNALVYWGEFTSLALAERALLTKLQLGAQKTQKQLIIINFNEQDTNKQKFRSLPDSDLLLKAFFPSIIWFDFQPNYHYNSPELSIEINHFIQTFSPQSLQIAAPLQQKLNLSTKKAQNKKAWMIIVEQNRQIWETLLTGRPAEANKLLGYYFFLNSYVISGNQLGTKIGFPTINMEINRQFFYPKLGCYVTVTLLEDNKKYFGLTCLFEKNPHEFYFETYLEKFSKKVYQDYARTYFLTFYRENKTIKSPDELKKLLTKDLKFLQNKPALERNWLI